MNGDLEEILPWTALKHELFGYKDLIPWIWPKPSDTLLPKPHDLYVMMYLRTV
jgi:hypothetical protein